VGSADRVSLPSALLNGSLVFLSFAGALNVDLEALVADQWTIPTLAI
jgi:hypothetical protein